MESIHGVIGKRPRSFKAPFNSIDSPSAFILLERIGFETDSSLPSYDNKSLGRFRAASTRHTSQSSLWSEGKMHLVEVPFTISPRLPYPFDTSETLTQTLARGMRPALESVDIQCRIDSLSGRNFTVVHITTHPWEFCDARASNGNGQRNVESLHVYLEELSARYDVDFLTVSEFAKRWENECCSLHSTERKCLSVAQD